MRQLLEAGVHFGHQTNKWNPKMAPYIFGSRSSIHILDLSQTIPLLHDALVKVREVAARNGRILFVGTKRAASEPIEKAAKRCGQFYVNHRWLGGMLMNWDQISNSIERLHQLDSILSENAAVPNEKDHLKLTREQNKLEQALGGIKNMGGIPDLMFVIDTNKEGVAVKEARRLGIPIIGIIDSNSNPTSVDYPIPGNDDATRAITLYCDLVADAVLDGTANKDFRYYEAMTDQFENAYTQHDNVVYDVRDEKYNGEIPENIQIEGVVLQGLFQFDGYKVAKTQVINTNSRVAFSWADNDVHDISARLNVKTDVYKSAEIVAGLLDKNNKWGSVKAEIFYEHCIETYEDVYDSLIEGVFLENLKKLSSIFTKTSPMGVRLFTEDSFLDFMFTGFLESKTSVLVRANKKLLDIVLVPFVHSCTTAHNEEMSLFAEEMEVIAKEMELEWAVLEDEKSDLLDEEASTTHQGNIIGLSDEAN